MEPTTPAYPLKFQAPDLEKRSKKSFAVLVTIVLALVVPITVVYVRNSQTSPETFAEVPTSIEAEDSVISGNMTVGTDPGASREKFLQLEGKAIPNSSTATTDCLVIPAGSASAIKTMTLPVSGTYKVWSRVSRTAEGPASYILQIDEACPVRVQPDHSVSPNAWVWLDYKNGDTNQQVLMDFTAGQHIIRFISDATQIQLDKIVLAKDHGCTPTGFGDNCTSTSAGTSQKVTSVSPTTQTSRVVPPQEISQITITSPVENTSVQKKTVVPITASVTNPLDLTTVEFAVNNVVKCTDRAEPYTCDWYVPSANETSYTLTATAVTTSGEKQTATTRITVL